MPLFAYVAMGATWLSAILPSAGIGMQNNFLSQLANFNYLNIGGMRQYVMTPKFVGSWIYLYTMNWKLTMVTGITAYKLEVII